MTHVAAPADLQGMGSQGAPGTPAAEALRAAQELLQVARSQRGLLREAGGARLALLMALRESLVEHLVESCRRAMRPQPGEPALQPPERARLLEILGELAAEDVGFAEELTCARSEAEAGLASLPAHRAAPAGGTARFTDATA